MIQVLDSMRQCIFYTVVQEIIVCRKSSFILVSISDLSSQKIVRYIWSFVID